METVEHQAYWTKERPLLDGTNVGLGAAYVRN